MNAHGELDNIYRTKTADVRPGHASEGAAKKYYRAYKEFVMSVAPPPGKLLDIGCGGGWSTGLFRSAGYQPIGIDLAPSFQAKGSSLLRANASAIPFRDASFDVVAMYQTLEHTPDPGTVIGESLRVLRPGGVLCIVGPNLLSIGASVAALTKWAWQNRPVRRILFRDMDMPRHPFGNTLPEVVLAGARNLGRIVSKSLSSKPELEMREPDLRPPFHGDNDACFLCNPLDLSNYLTSVGCDIIQLDKPGRLKVVRMLATGTFVAARRC